MSFWGKASGKGKGKGKGKTQGHTLPRTRLSAAKFQGTVSMWKGKYGWITPGEEIAHEKAKMHQGLFVGVNDLQGAASLEVGAPVEFHIFEDSSGLGAEEVVVLGAATAEGTAAAQQACALAKAETQKKYGTASGKGKGKGKGKSWESSYGGGKGDMMSMMWDMLMGSKGKGKSFGKGKGKGGGQKTFQADESGGVLGELTGTIKSFSDKNYYGFIECPQLQAMGYQDAFLHGDEKRGYRVGHTIKFTAVLSKDGKPQAKDLKSGLK